MNSQQEQFLNLHRLPARLRVEETALLLGFSVQEIPILAARGLIKPLGHPPLTGTKYFAAAVLEELRRDEKWLAKASDCIVGYWREVNRKRNPSRDLQTVHKGGVTTTSSNPTRYYGVSCESLNNKTINQIPKGMAGTNT